MQLTGNHLRGVVHGAAAVIVAASCHEPSGLPEIAAPAQPAKVVSIKAASDTIFSGTAGSAGPVLAVIARDSAANIVSGAVVRFVVDLPPNLQFYVDATAGADGIARLITWNLGAFTGLNVVNATVGIVQPVTFRVTGVAGPPARMARVSGEEQHVATGASVSVPPSVRVTDAYGNPTRGVPVRFAVSAGQSELTDSVATSDSAGVATAGRWTLMTAGLHTLVASSPGLQQTYFNAVATSSRLPCGQQNILLQQVELISALSGVSCKDAAGRLYDVLSVFPIDDSYDFSLTSDDFDTLLEIRDEAGTVVASNDNRSSGSTNSRITILTAGRPLTLIAAAQRVGASGAYTASYRGVAHENGCDAVFAVIGVSMNRELQSRKCDAPDNDHGDRFRIFLKKGKMLIVDVTDLDYSAWFVDLYDDSGNRIAEGVDSASSYVTTLKTVVPSDGFYTIKVSSPDYYSAYHLSIQ